MSQEDLQQTILNAGFREGTPIEKVKVLIFGGKWKPTTNKAIEATEQLKQHFSSSSNKTKTNEEEAEDLFEEENKSDMIKLWGHFYGLEFFPQTSKDEKIYYQMERLKTEKTLKEEFGMDVSGWGNPLQYDIQE